VSSVEHRILAFVAWHGEIPAEATRIEDHRARQHAVSWIRRNIGVGIVHSYVIGYELGDRWWTLFCDRSDTYASGDAEVWEMEAYNHAGDSWSAQFYYWPETGRWRHVQFLQSGDDYGRHISQQR
jgi:hypothetical protein